MSRIYLFDVDGTLTPAKAKIDKKFKSQFLEWMQNKEVYIVSGGSFVRILDQLGDSIVNQTHGVFACMGNVFCQRRDDSAHRAFNEWDIIYENKFKAPAGLYKDLDRIVKESDFPLKASNHYEERIGMLNFSIVGRNATPEQRKAYQEYDPDHAEREKIVAELKGKYRTLDFVIGGAVSIDVFNSGNDKSQVVERYFKEALECNEIVFVGDRIPFPGNDYALAVALRQHPNGSAYEVETWEDTAVLLKTDAFA